MLIQVDVDSTLYDSDVLFNKVSKDYGFEWPKSYDHWFNAEFLGTTLDNMLAMFAEAHSDKYALDVEPYPYAQETLAGIARDYDVEIAYISDRSTKLGETLRTWLDTKGFLTDDQQHVEATKDKREWMRENRPGIVIDDRVRTMLMARYELGSTVFSLSHPYNCNLTGEADGIYILNDWQEIDTALRQNLDTYLETDFLGRKYEVVG